MLSSFPQVAATYRRPTGEYVEGVWVADSVDEADLMIINPQPASGKELLLLPEGNRDLNHLKMWTETALQIDDVVTHGGTEYLVVKVGDYNPDGGFYRVLMQEVQ